MTEFCQGWHQLRLRLPATCALIALLVAAPAIGQEIELETDSASLLLPAPPEEGTWTLEELESLALSNNPTLEQARVGTWQAHGKYIQAGLYPNPTLAYSAGEVGNGGTAGQQGFYLQQEFVMGGKLQLSSAAAAQGQRLAEQTLTIQQYNVVNAVRREFYSVLTARRLHELAEELLDIAEAGKRITSARFEQFEASKLDDLQQEVLVQRAQVLLATAQNQQNAAWQRLVAVLGLPGLEERKVYGDLEEDIPDVTFEATMARLLELSPQLGAARVAADRAYATYCRETVQPIPNVTVQAGTQYDYDTDTQIANIQVGVPLPIFDRNQGNITAAHSEWIRASRDIQRIELVLRSGLADVFQEYASNRAEVIRFREGILPATSESLSLSQTTYDAGDLEFLQLLTAQRTYAETYREYVLALGELWRSIVAIDGLLLVDGLAQPALP